MKNSRTIIGILALLLFIAEAIVVVGSWIGSVLSPDNITSMLSSKGVRWFVGSFSSMLSTPVLVNILLLGMTIGIVERSGIMTVLTSGHIKNRSYSERLGMQLAFVLFAVLTVIVLLLAFLPHAVLVNASGSIINSSFSRGFIPMLALCISMPSAVYGLCSANTNSVASVFEAFSYGISKVSPVVLLYMLASQLYYSIAYILA